MRSVTGRRFYDACEQRAFCNGQFRNILAEIDLSRCGQPVGAPTKIYDIEIAFQDLRFAHALFKLQCELYFLNLSRNGFFAGQMCQLDELLSDRGSTLSVAERLDVLKQRAEHAVNVNTVMLVKAQVFCSDECRLNMPGDVFNADERAVFAAVKRSRKRAVYIIDERGGRDLRKH